MNIIKLIIFVIMLTNVLPLQAKTLRLSLEEAIEIALKQNEDIKMAQISEEQALKEYEMVRSHMLPNISAQGTFSKYVDRSMVPQAVPGPTGVAVFTEMPIKRQYGLETQIVATQVLFSFGQIYYSVQAANQGIEIKKIQRENTRQEIIFNTTNAYVSVLLSEAALEIARESHNNAVNIKNTLINRYSQGRAPQADLVKIGRDIAFRWTEVLKAQNQFHMAKAGLKYYLNIEQNTNIIPTSNLSSLELKTEKIKNDNLLLGNSNILTLEKKVMADNYMIKSKMASFMPTISGFAAYNHTGSSENKDFSGVPGINHVGTIGVQVNIPLFEGGKKSSAYQEAVLEKNKSMIELEKAKRSILLELTNSEFELTSHKSIYRQNLESIDLAKKTFQISQKRFASGQTSITELNDAELLLTQAKINKELTLYKINQLKAKINRLLN